MESGVSAGGGAQFVRSEFSFAQSLRGALFKSLENRDYLYWHDPCIAPLNPAAAFVCGHGII
jgi:hypothetical protein